MLLVEMMMQRVIVSKHQKTSMYLGQWNRNNVPVGNYFGLDCTSIVAQNILERSGRVGILYCQSAMDATIVDPKDEGEEKTLESMSPILSILKA